jgi:hypothetical protein
VRAYDWVLRTFQPSHVRIYRSRELEALFAAAGLAHRRTRWLLGGGYMIMAAAKPRP